MLLVRARRHYRGPRRSTKLTIANSMTAPQRHQQTGCAEVAVVDGRYAENRAQQPTAQRSAKNAHDDVEQNALLRSQERARRPSDQTTDDEQMMVFMTVSCD